MHKLISILLVIGAYSVISLPAFAQNDSISTYDGWITASFDALDEDNNQRAEQCLKNAMRLEPANPQNGLLFVNLGTIQRRLGKLQDAEISYTCAISLLDENTVAYSTRASLYAEIEQYQKAIDDYSVVISRNPEDEDALYERALCRLMNSDTIGARLDLETIDKFNPKSAKSRLGMAMVYKAMGENAMAVELYDALIKANPKSWSLLRDRGLFLQQATRCCNARHRQEHTDERPRPSVLFPPRKNPLGKGRPRVCPTRPQSCHRIRSSAVSRSRFDRKNEIVCNKFALFSKIFADFLFFIICNRYICAKIVGIL